MFRDNTMESGWKCIYSSSSLSEVLLKQGLLEDNEINSVIINKQDSAYLFGEIEIYVKTEDILMAKRLISETEQ
jgi:hypothetical protein